MGGGTRASLGPSPGWGAVVSVEPAGPAGASSGSGRFSPGRSRRPLPGTTTAACSNASSPSRFSSRSTARRRDRWVGAAGVASGSSSSSAPWMTRSRRSRTRWGIWRTGVPVTTSAPNSARSTSSTTAPGRDTAEASGLEARNPMMPPAARIGSAPPGGFGMPSEMWASPQAAKVSATVPTTRRFVTASSLGARRKYSPKASRTSGTAYPTRPRVPATTAWMTSPTTPVTPHHSRAATTTASPMSANPTPSRRCSGSRSRAELPTRRTAPPARCETPIQVPRMARSGSGSPPERAFEVRRAAGLRGAERPPRPVAWRDVGTRPADGRDDVEDARGAMVGTVRESHLRLTRHTRPSVRGAERPSSPGVVSDRERSVLLLDMVPRASLPS